MSAYTKEEFEQYKGEAVSLSVGYEYPKGNWEWIDHETYEDYINTFESYLNMYDTSFFEIDVDKESVERFIKDLELFEKKRAEEGGMTYTQEQYAELESLCDNWRQLCYKHEQTICNLKYQIVVLEAAAKDNNSLCTKCNGTGIELYYNHGYGEDSVEPIKCKGCDGFGRVQKEE